MSTSDVDLTAPPWSTYKNGLISNPRTLQGYQRQADQHPLIIFVCRCKKS